MGKLTVGQKLWYVPSDSRYAGQACEVTVERIGRKWANISHGYRIDLADWWVDGGQHSSPGRCYASKEAWDDEGHRQKAWRAVREGFGYRGAPPGITIDAIYQAAALLGIELPARSDTGLTSPKPD